MPVRTESPSTIVVCPIRTPATSVMAFNGPGWNTPGLTPISLARGRLSWATAGAFPSRPNVNAMITRMEDSGGQGFGLDIIVKQGPTTVSQKRGLLPSSLPNGKEAVLCPRFPTDAVLLTAIRATAHELCPFNVYLASAMVTHVVPTDCSIT